ncbi:type IV secretory system conjugative DNA transfer family protein [Patescibacteria group bacterium]
MDTIDTINNIIQIFLAILILVSFGFLIFSLIARFGRKRREKLDKFKLTFLQIKLPPDNEIEIKAAEHMFSNLIGFKKGFFKALFTGQYRISIEIVGKKEGISFYVVIPNDIAPMVEKQINAAYPVAEIDIINPHEIWDRGKYTKVSEFKLRGPHYYPIKVYEDLKNDSLSSITSAMSNLTADEVLAVQYVLQPAKDGWRLGGRRYIGNVKVRQAQAEKPINIDEKFLEGIEGKIENPGFYTKIRVISIAADKVSAESQVQNMGSAFEQFTNPTYNKFIKKSPFFPRKLVNDFVYRKIRVTNLSIPILGISLYSNVSVLNTIELATVFHFPNKDVGTPNIVWLGSRKSQAPTETPDEGIYLGDSLFRGVKKEILIKERDRTRHFYILGQTGSGKSELMKLMAIQDIKNGEGVAFIDPHGTDIDDLLTKIPPERKDDVILFDASDTEMPLGINMLEAHSEEEKHIIINSFIALLYKLYDPNKQGIMGPILERAIRNVMLTAMTDPEATMVDVLRLFIDENYSKKFLDKITDPLVKRYWTDEIANTSDSRKSETMGYFVSKFDRLLTDKTMRNMIGQPKTSFDIGEIMAQKKILLVDLAKGKLGEENSSFIGLLLVPRILAAALQRHKLKGDFPDFYLYVDEFQNFATDDFATILSEARKYKLNLTVGHQFIEQLPESIKDAVFGNVGTTCIFRVGVEDAEFLEPQFEPHFNKQDLIKLPVGNAYIRLLVDGQPTEPFSIKVDLDKIQTETSHAVADEIRKTSREKYGVPIEEVEKMINSRIEESTSIQPTPLSKIPF